jgi:hypothetical protein
MSTSFCKFEDTGKIFQDKKIYKCSYCGSQLALEDPSISIICFKKHNEIMSDIENSIYTNQKPTLNLHATSEEHFKQLVAQQVDLERSEIPGVQNNSTDLLCTKEEIDQRLSICQGCEHFKDNSCLLCGCVVVRDANFNNKLAHKRHSCPINKWGPIIDSINS